MPADDGVTSLDVFTVLSVYLMLFCAFIFIIFLAIKTVVNFVW